MKQTPHHIQSAGAAQSSIREDGRGRSEEKRGLTYVGLELVMSWEGRRNGTGVARRTISETLD